MITPVKKMLNFADTGSPSSMSDDSSDQAMCDQTKKVLIEKLFKLTAEGSMTADEFAKVIAVIKNNNDQARAKIEQDAYGAAQRTAY